MLQSFPSFFVLVLSLSLCSYVQCGLFPLKCNGKAAPENNEKSSFPAYGNPLPRMRGDIATIVSRLGMTTGAEIGVQRGIFAAEILRRWPKCEKFYLVDLWQHQSVYNDSANIEQAAQDRNYEITKQNVKYFRDVPILIKKSSIEAAKDVKNQTLDFIYLDARHDYCAVLEDIYAWYPKLRIGGIIGGHDFLTAEEAHGRNPNENWQYCEDKSLQAGAVKGAVEQFACRYNIQVYSTLEGWPSWYYSRKTREI
jgi:hypothetical protein